MAEKTEDPGAAATTPPAVVYRVVDPGGLEWRDPVSGRRKFAKAGARRADLPAISIRWLLEGGHIEVVAEAADPPAEEGD